MSDDVKDTPEQEQENQEAPVAFSVTDLIAVQQIIAIAQSRGAFKAEEMSQVGIVYDKLVKFLTSVQEQTQEPQEEEPEAEE